jgi:hypothetical protein
VVVEAIGLHKVLIELTLFYVIISLLLCVELATDQYASCWEEKKLVLSLSRKVDEEADGEACPEPPHGILPLDGMKDLLFLRVLEFVPLSELLIVKEDVDGYSLLANVIPHFLIN